MEMTEAPMQFALGPFVDQYRKNPELTWTRILCEFIDNALDAHASVIRITKDGPLLIIRDDGIGCADPTRMVDLGLSHAHGGDRSGFFGLGGKAAGIRASGGSKVEYTTVSGGILYRIVVDWGEIIRTNRSTRQEGHRPAFEGENGTVVTIYNCRQITGIERIIRDLGFRYCDGLEGAMAIDLHLNGKLHAIRAYQPPPFEDRVDFDFQCDGSPVRGYCGLVERGEKNPYPGWVIHWGPHRVMTTIHEPAGGKSVKSLHGHVYLPSDWRNHNLTKDDFEYPPEPLYELLATRCQRIIDASDQEATDIHIEAFTESVTIALNDAIPPRVKGRRSGSAGKKGTIEPSENGHCHVEFGPNQPGDKGHPRDREQREPQHSKYLYRLEWRDDLLSPWQVKTSHSARAPSWIYLDKTNLALSGYVDRNEPDGLATFLLKIIADHLGCYRDEQLRLGCYEQLRSEDWFERFTRTPTPAAAP